MEKYMMSRSSPCTLSRFLTKTGSSSASEKNGSSPGSLRRSSSSKSSIRLCCSELKVTTPMVAPDCANPGDCSRADRKSTRLNSSHQIISYAVFCLKKKKQNHTIIKETLQLRVNTWMSVNNM